MYRIKGRLRRWTFGTYPAVRLATARDMAKEGLRDVAKGLDPARHKVADRTAPTFKLLAADYIERWAKKRKKTWRKDEQIINRELLPRFGSRKAAGIGRGEIREAFETVADRAPVAANRMIEVAKRIWNWALEVDYPTITINPCAGIKKIEEVGGARWLRPSEIAAVWKATDELEFRWQAFCRLCLLTGQHPGEILTMQRDQIERTDDGGAWWVMPEGHHKADWSHSVYLTPLAVEAIEVASQASKDPDYLFPARGGGKSDPENVPWKRTIATLLEKSKVARFSARDFRPTVATGLESEPLGISQVIVAKVLGHANPAITARYTRHGYDQEKRRAMLAWSSRIEDLASGKPADSKVIPLRKA
jgi:integrase